jgi:hypothetical protein
MRSHLLQESQAEQNIFPRPAENPEFPYGEMEPSGFPLVAEAAPSFKSVSRQSQPR